MQQYTLQQRKRIIFTFITQQIKTGKPIDDWLMKVAKNGFKTWDFDYILEHIKRYYINVGGYNENNVNEVIEFEILKETNYS